MARSAGSFKPQDPVRRFYAQIDPTPGGCWEWTGTRSQTGYGRFWDGQRNTAAHRFGWLLDDRSLPEGSELDHTCRNRGCVNPAHLEAVSHHENVLRGRDARMPTCAAGHAWTPENVIPRGIAGRRCRICTNAFYRVRRTKRAQEGRLPVSDRTGQMKVAA